MRRFYTILTTLVVATILLTAATGTALADDRADLEITNPEFVDEEVEVDRGENATIYHVQGPEQTVVFENAAYGNVTDYGTLEGPGSLSFDSDRDVFVFDPEGAEATTHVFFEVDDEQRYTADIRTSNVEWAHLPADEYDEQQEALSTWESVQRDAQGVVPNQDPVETIESGLSYAQFFDSPFSRMTQDMQGVLIMMFMTPGGLFITGIIGLTVVVVLAKHYRYKNRTQKQFAELEELDREMDEAWLQKARKILQQCDHNDLWPDHLARAVRDLLGNNVWVAFKEYSLIRSPTSVKGTVLQAMGQVGYEASVHYDADGRVTNARVVETDRDPDDDSFEDVPIADGGTVKTVNLTNLSYDDDHDRAIIETIPADDIDESVFDADLDVSEISFPIDNREVSDSQLLEELNPSFPGDFEDREQFARVLAELMQFVANHDHSDDEGRVRGEKDLLSFMMELDTILHDEADFPPAFVMQKELLCAAEHMDKGERLNERVETAELDGVGATRIDVGGTGVGGD